MGKKKGGSDEDVMPVSLERMATEDVLARSNGDTHGQQKKKKRTKDGKKNKPKTVHGSSSDSDSDDNSSPRKQKAPPLVKENRGVTFSKTSGKGVVDVEDFAEDRFFGQTRLSEKGGDNDSLDPSENLVVMRNVHKTYLLGIEGVPALRGVNMHIKAGEFVVIFGTSGGGKTTMLNILGTIDKPTKGELFIDNSRITESTKDHELSDIRLRKIGFVFQTFNLLSSLTALENVEMPLILDGRLSVAERRARAEEVLSQVGMRPRLNHVPSQLSGGEQQRVTIARALSNRPSLMLLDEPTGDLDSDNTLIVMKLLADLNREEGITMVMVTHDVSLKYFANRVVWMRDGKIQRIESVSNEKRQETYDKLESDLKEMKRAKKSRAKRGHGTTVELRTPTDYATHPDHVERQVPVHDAALLAKRRQREADASPDYSSSDSESDTE